MLPSWRVELTDVVLVFEVHQPFRVKKGYFWDHKMFQHIDRTELFAYYFDTHSDRAIFERASRKCYLPTNQIILTAIDEHRREPRPFKVAYSLSGLFLEQCERFNGDVLDSFRQLAATGHVEFLDQTHHHSLASLYPVRKEFIEQVRLHRNAIRDLLHYEPSVFENTELLYNNAIARVVETLGYGGILTEGADRILKGQSPNYLYSAKDCKTLRVLLRNYKLTDDVGFRFSARWWSEWPLTADKYAAWLSTTPGQYINIFPDYETFGEHHWPETGIHKFLAHLPAEILKRANLSFATPSEVIQKHEPVGMIDVPELGGTVSWADTERATSSWLGNTMQWAYYSKLRQLEPLVKEAQDPELLRIWRCLQTSDHLYYMFTSGGAPGVVHTYFSPYESPTDAFVTCLAALTDFEQRVRAFTLAANEPFRFHSGVGEEKYVGVDAWSLRGFATAVQKVSVRSLGFHNARADFEQWARLSLRDEALAKAFARISASGAKGRLLKAALSRAARTRLGRLRH